MASPEFIREERNKTVTKHSANIRWRVMCLSVPLLYLDCCWHWMLLECVAASLEIRASSSTMHQAWNIHKVIMFWKAIFIFWYISTELKEWSMELSSSLHFKSNNYKLYADYQMDIKKILQILQYFL